MLLKIASLFIMMKLFLFLPFLLIGCHCNEKIVIAKPVYTQPPISKELRDSIYKSELAYFYASQVHPDSVGYRILDSLAINLLHN